MTDVSNRKRQPKGVPIGGEFAANEHDEASNSLNAIIERDNILAIDAEHIDAVEDAVGAHPGKLVTRQDAEELLSAESGTRPRMYGLKESNVEGGYEIVTLRSQYDLDRHEAVAQWVSDTTVADLVSPAGSTYDEIRETPTDADRAAARDYVRVVLSNDNYPNGEHGWKNVIGAKAPRTEANIEKYNAHLDALIDADPFRVGQIEKIARRNAANDSYARAFEQGVPIHPAAEAHFEEVWTGEHAWNEENTKLEQQSLVRLREGLMTGTVRPSSIVGTGMRNPKKSAIEYLDRQDVEIARALATRGRSRATLANNADGRVRRSLAGE